MKKIDLPAKSFYLASYPRSGNTWMLYSLTMLFSALVCEARCSPNRWEYVYGDVDGNNFFIRAEHPLDGSRPLIIKTHDDYETFSRLYPSKPCIYIYRDGRDVLVSLYFFMKAFADPKDMVLIEVGSNHDVAARSKKNVVFDQKEFTEFILTYSPLWTAHVRSWLNAKDVYIIRYEDLHVKYSVILNDVIDYLKIRPVVSVQDVEKIYVTEYRDLFKNNRQDFFRRGIVGDWKHYFSKEDDNLFLSIAGDIMN